ncbi:MAG: protein-L-isoaspartate O-methyltransferase [Pelagerythrobacter marensis]|nr:MAG: protein-L-isoaspartate O-methyltransferase [Pelagerythrobacter marensis]
MTATDTLSPASPSLDFDAARRAMIDSQLRPSGVNAPMVLERMAAVPRERFVPAALADVAYIDRSIALGDGGHLAAPLFYGQLLVEARPVPSDRVLVVDGGSGYLAELVRPLVAATDSVTPAELGKVAAGAGYTLVLIDGAGEQLPPELSAAMAEGGRVLGGVIQRGITSLAVGRKAGSDLALMPLTEMGIPRIAAFDAPKGWSF